MLPPGMICSRFDYKHITWSIYEKSTLKKKMNPFDGEGRIVKTVIETEEKQKWSDRRSLSVPVCYHRSFNYIAIY